MIAVPLYAVLFAAGLLPRGAPIDSLDSVLGFGSGVLILALVVTIFFAIPAVNWLAGRGPLSLRRLMALGALLGNIPFITIAVVVAAVQLARGTLTADVGQYWEGSAGALVRVAMGIIVGAGSALILWVVAIEGNGSSDTRAIGQRRLVARPPGRPRDAAH